MTNSREIGIDHLMVGTPDLEETHGKLRRLGFATTPRGVHDRLGTANHTALFADDTYLEIIGIVSPGPANAAYRNAIDALREDVAGLALKTEDAADFYEFVSGGGLAPEPPLDFERWVGEAGLMAGFSIVRLPMETLPPLSLFACQHRTPELVWLPGYTTHPNAVTGIAALVFADPSGKGADVFSRLLGQPPSRQGETATIAAGSVELLFVQNAAFPASNDNAPAPPLRVDKIVFSVSDLAQTQSWLSLHGVAAQQSGTRLCIAAGEILIPALEFSQTDL